MTRTRYRIYEEEYPYFLTNTIVAWLPIFAHPKLVEIVANSWRFLQKERDIDIFGYVVMENHLHWIAAGKELSNQVGRFKSYTARRIIDEMERLGFHTILEELKYYKSRHKVDQQYQLWHEGSHPEQFQTEQMMWQKLEYIQNNPVRRGYVSDPTHWRYSSARNYAGMDGLIEIVADWT